MSDFVSDPPQVFGYPHGLLGHLAAACQPADHRHWRRSRYVRRRACFFGGSLQFPVRLETDHGRISDRLRSKQFRHLMRGRRLPTNHPLNQTVGLVGEPDGLLSEPDRGPAAEISRIRGIKAPSCRRKRISAVTATQGHTSVRMCASTSLATAIFGLRSIVRGQPSRLRRRFRITPGCRPRATRVHAGLGPAGTRLAAATAAPDVRLNGLKAHGQVQSVVSPANLAQATPALSGG